MVHVFHLMLVQEVVGGLGAVEVDGPLLAVVPDQRVVHGDVVVEHLGLQVHYEKYCLQRICISSIIPY